ncbi:TPA: hypothetical protein DIC20_02815 [Candidatus Dependentiae bacterium]|nr:MAG: hypothetical protein US03_C0009G0024 [candidate division TM6 bacterium GW2011_GWF2_36_131]KKQ02862.1 MAG: hypothetical protein US13_C0009G0054 [candidate division TM6 bacterium GW2011_GWE2_36_25]KKQ19515.1 MAG: hypothetical protein US32_C0008G0016 [candidate division TM6 bacterium GW2011_GWA2_36_9]HBR70228.1 hypothetical protein [Candidatus Dependentiae bacterium]HCU00612.1 hypothetical protein [Candidatus Dependentiae bacterium]
MKKILLVLLLSNTASIFGLSGKLGENMNDKLRYGGDLDKYMTGDYNMKREALTLFQRLLRNGLVPLSATGREYVMGPCLVIGKDDKGKYQIFLGTSAEGISRPSNGRYQISIGNGKFIETIESDIFVPNPMEKGKLEIQS